MGCKTRRDIINLLREEPMFVSEISNELDIGQKAIIAHLRAMEDIGILNSSYKKIVRGRPRKYYDLQNEVNIHITINRNTFDVNFSEDMLNTLQLPSGDEWSKLLDIERRIDDGQLEAIDVTMRHWKRSREAEASWAIAARMAAQASVTRSISSPRLVV